MNNTYTRERIEWLLEGTILLWPELYYSPEDKPPPLSSYKGIDRASFENYVTELTNSNSVEEAAYVLFSWLQLTDQNLQSTIPPQIVELTQELENYQERTRTNTTAELRNRINTETYDLAKAGKIPRPPEIKERVPSKPPSKKLYVKKTKDSIDFKLSKSQYKRLETMRMAAELDPVTFEKNLKKNILLSFRLLNKKFEDSQTMKLVELAASKAARETRKAVLGVQDSAFGINLVPILRALSNPSNPLTLSVLSSDEARTLAKQSLETALIKNTDLERSKRLVAPVVGVEIAKALFGAGGVKFELTDKASGEEVDLAAVAELHKGLAKYSKLIVKSKNNFDIRTQVSQLVDSLLAKVRAETLTAVRARSVADRFVSELLGRDSLGLRLREKYSEDNQTELLWAAKEFSENPNLPDIDSEVLEYASMSEEEGYSNPQASHLFDLQKPSIRRESRFENIIKKKKGELRNELRTKIKSEAKRAIRKSLKKFRLKKSLGKILSAAKSFLPEILVVTGAVIYLAVVGLWLFKGGGFKWLDKTSANLLRWLDKSANSLVKGFGKAMNRLGRALGFGAIQAVKNFAKVSVVTTIGTIALVAVILFIINSGAYIVPPGNDISPLSTGGSLESVSIKVEKTANTEALENSQLPTTITYTVEITPKKGALSEVSFDNSYSLFQDPETALVPDPEIPDPPETGVISPSSEPYALTYTLDIDSTYNDSILCDNFSVSAVTEFGQETAIGVACVTVGDPPEDCPAGWPVATNQGQEYFIMQGPNGGATHQGREAADVHPVENGYPNIATSSDLGIATHKGNIVSMGVDGAGGLYVDIQGICADQDFRSRHVHFDSFAGGLSNGQLVNRGTILGIIGNTGAAFNPHDHYEFRALNDGGGGPAQSPVPILLESPFVPQSIPRSCLGLPGCNLCINISCSEIK